MITKQTLDFLVQNRIMDSRTWFHEHHDEYQALVRQPMVELVQSLTLTIQAIDPEITVEPNRVISRVNRDLRFSKDKTLYRDVMWLTFTRKQEANTAPAFFFEFSFEGFRFGCGYYGTNTALMRRMRELILQDHPLFQKAFQFFQRQDQFVIEGERYKRSKHPQESAELRNWLDRKNLYLTHNSTDVKLLCSEQILEQVQHGFQQLMPVYQFLQEVHTSTQMKQFHS